MHTSPRMAEGPCGTNAEWNCATMPAWARLSSISWSDFRPRIAIVTLDFIYYHLDSIWMMENSRFLIFTFDFERAKRETNTKLPLRLLSPVYHIPLPFGSGCLVLYIPLLISTHCLCSRTTAQALDPVFLRRGPSSVLSIYSVALFYSTTSDA